MKNNLPRKLLITSLVIVFLSSFLGLVGNLLTNRPDFNNSLQSISTGTLTLIVVTTGIGLLIFSFLQFRYAEQSEQTETLTENIEPDVKRFFDSLKERYQQRYESKLDGRFEIKLEVSEDWHGDKPRTYKFDAEAKISDAVDAVRNAFDEKGRLLIVGSPGSGKTVLLLKLARELLGDEFKADQKLPVIFNLASWSEDYRTFEDWLIDVLNSGNGLSKDFAKAILREKRIIFLLDGLDELARNEIIKNKIDEEVRHQKLMGINPSRVLSDEELRDSLNEIKSIYKGEDSKNAHQIRAKCLDSLNDYLREGRQAVICCRREEFAEMQKITNQDAPVSAKVEVLDLTKGDILLALHDARKHIESRASAENLEKIIETDEVFLEVLSTPFYFTTALEVFDKHLLKQTDFPTGMEEPKKYLLEKFVESKINHTRNLVEFENDTTKIKKWLKWLAELMEKKQLVSFSLIDLQPTDLINDKKFVKFSSFNNFALFSFIKDWKRWDALKIRSEDSVYLDVSKFFSVRYWFEPLNHMLVMLPVSLGIGLLLSIKDGLTAGLILSISAAIMHIFFTGMTICFENLKEFRNVNRPKDAYQKIYGGFLLNLCFAILLSSLLVLGFYGTQNLKQKVKQVLYPTSPAFLKYDSIDSLSDEEIIKLYNQEIEWLNQQEEREQNSSYILLKAFASALDIILFLYIYFAYSIVLPLLLRTTLVKHFVLRRYLWREGSIPFKYATFLDNAAEARILEKDGGQWRFRHQYLQEYFANLKD